MTKQETQHRAILGKGDAARHFVLMDERKNLDLWVLPGGFTCSTGKLKRYAKNCGLDFSVVPDYPVFRADIGDK